MGGGSSDMAPPNPAAPAPIEEREDSTDPPAPHPHTVIDSVPERNIHFNRLLTDAAFVVLLFVVVVLNVLIFLMESIQKVAEVLIILTSYFIRYALLSPLDYCMHFISSLGNDGVPVALLYVGRDTSAPPTWTPPTWHLMSPPTTSVIPAASMPCHNGCMDRKKEEVNPGGSKSQPACLMSQPACLKPSKVCGSVCFLMDKGKCMETCLQ